MIHIGGRIMIDIMDEIYQIVEDEVDRRCYGMQGLRELESSRGILWDEVIQRMGKDGERSLEAITALDMEIAAIHDKALFRVALELGAEIRGPRRRTWTA